MRSRLPIPSLALLFLVHAAAAAADPAARRPDDYAASGKRPDGAESKKDKDEKPPPWKVNDPPGPKTTAAIDTDEGTWMSLDVSPAGDEIAFDLLGDVYVLPIAGGEARALRTGIAWEMQPRYSPDGGSIAFTSDAGGGDNLWVMRRDGGDPRPVSKEDFRLVNSPAWSPDGEFLAVRKHFTAERSLGTGEIWLYHRSGGKGLPMTKKSNDQKDLGEPAFSPDGRYLYFSEDTSPGKEFRYNKDPHGQIYVILRLDREDGRIEDFVTGPGGSVRPTPSPDGRYVAFVRRSGLKTALWLHEVESGRETEVYDGLDRDLQETWAIHGVYPALAWTPDSRSLVFWAGGKIRRIAAAAGAAAAVIPFHVRATMERRQALRFPVAVAPPRWHTKMLRWVTVSPDGAEAVFQALGKLYLRRLAGGEPRRLTRDEDGFEMYPAFSRDGSRVVYTTWSDRDLGSVRVVPVAGGPSLPIAPRPGHYVEPVFAPDGETVVYRKVAADSLRSRQWTHDLGLFAVPARGGEPRRVVRDGTSPHFGAHPDRLYFLAEEGEGEEKRQLLKSIDLDGSDERTEARSEMATDYRVSPDGRFVAFQDQFQVFVTPLPATGRPIDLGPKSEALPLRRLSRDAGNYLHWSGDGKRLHWSLGPELFTAELKDAFPFLPGAPAKPAPQPEHGIDLGFDFPADAPAGKLALVGGRVVTMRGSEVIERGTVLVEGNRITAVGAEGTVAIPAGARQVDVAGATVLPGIVDVHYHGPQGEDGILPEQNWSLHAALAFGVTTAHDPSSDTETFFAAADLARAGKVLAPRLFSTGRVLYGARSPYKAVIDSLEDARRHLKMLRAVGAFSVKSYNQPRREQRQQVIAAARELGLMVVPEGGSLYHHNLTMVVDGHTGVEHALPIGAGYRDLVQLWAGSGVGYTPTMVVGYGGVFGENYWYQKTDVFDHERLRRFVPPFVLEPRARRRTVMLSDGDWNHFRVARLARQLADAGVSVQIGAHGQREGLGAHWEMWMLVDGGFSPFQALQAATIRGAAYLGLDHDLGSIEPGKLADLMVVDGDPLADIRASENVRYTLLDGRLYQAATMTPVAEDGQVGAPPRYFWREEGERERP